MTLMKSATEKTRELLVEFSLASDAVRFAVRKCSLLKLLPRGLSQAGGLRQRVKTEKQLRLRTEDYVPASRLPTSHVPLFLLSLSPKNMLIHEEEELPLIHGVFF